MTAAGAAQQPAANFRAPTLSVEQLRVVEHRSGALLVFAGPGSGKTRTLTARIAALLMSGRARAHEILALTFTVRAAEEMRVRLTALIGQQAASAVTVATFHSLGARLLRLHAGVFGRTAAFSVYDSDDILRVIGDVLAEDGTGEPPAELCRDMRSQIATAKGGLLSWEALSSGVRDADGVRLAEVWQRVEQEMRDSDAFDFADLITSSVTLLTEHPAVRQRHRDRWRHIVVDEFQDTDASQFALLLRLAGASGCAPHGSLVVAGDDDQLLYRWRGADVGHLLGFRDAYPCAAEVVLRHNYRCRPEILDAAARCIRHNEQRRAKQAIAARAEGGTVVIARFSNDHQEAAVVARRIASAIACGTDPREILVLCRSLRYTTPLQRALGAAAIAYRVIGAHSLWERVEVLDALAYVALVANPHDGAAFRRAISAPSDRRQFARAKRQAPTRGVGAATQRRVIAHAREVGLDLIEVSATAGEWSAAGDRAGVGSVARASLVLFGQQLAGVRREHLQGASIARTVIDALTISGGPVDCYDELLQSTDEPEIAADCARIKEDLRSLCRAAHSYEQRHGGDASLAGFLEETRVDPGSTLTAEQDDRLTISTIHAAKGTEADLVFVIGCEERLLPIGYAIDDADPLRIEEERRLFYVAVTRARNGLMLSIAAERLGKRVGAPTRFLVEAEACRGARGV